MKITVTEDLLNELDRIHGIDAMREIREVVEMNFGTQYEIEILKSSVSLEEVLAKGEK